MKIKWNKLYETLQVNIHQRSSSSHLLLLFTNIGQLYVHGDYRLLKALIPIEMHWNSTFSGVPVAILLVINLVVQICLRMALG